MLWKKNLYVMCLAQFLAMSSMQLIMPFLPFYIEKLGVTEPGAVTVWTGIIASANFLASAIMSPVWGNMTDRLGCKIMVLRSLVALATFAVFLSLAQNVYQFTAIRALMGAFSGFNAAAIALVAVNTPEQHLGYALGLLQTAQVAGTITGPLFGGIIASLYGYHQVFHLITLINALAAVMVYVLIRESFGPGCTVRDIHDPAEESGSSPGQTPLWVVFVVIFIAQLSVRVAEPMVPIFVKSLYQDERFLSLIAGIIIASTGVANVLGAPVLGRRSDRSGYKLTLVLSLTGAGFLYLAQTLASSPWQLGILRFLLGFCMAGIFPAANAIVGHLFPKEKRGKAYGIISSATFLGNFAGPLAGGLIAARFSVHAVFPVTGALLLINAVWVVKSLVEPRKIFNPGQQEN
ncbi:MFS transporter [Desulfofundulus salinus]|uniref:MFS transporter n=1 Tax=Desulfofundulus salinus TaxID=2419843 RepID=A0A494WRK5_9FIRM|nr:MFS transporter [Desulfofundulus salinum]RKO65869.1 MFS transporter [Desulfofundulus salinum]